MNSNRLLAYLSTTIHGEHTESSGNPARGISRLCLVAAIASAIAFLCFLPSLQNGLLNWDDTGYVLANEQIRSFSLETIRWSFTTFYCNYWTPFTWLSYAIDFQLYGLNPSGYHLTNTIIHALNTGLFCVLAGKLLSYRHQHGTPENMPSMLPAAGGQSYLLQIALLAALLFGIHPLRVESVAWVTERKDVLAMFFGLLALLAYLHHLGWCERKAGTAPLPALAFLSSSHYWATFLFFSCSLSSKGMFVILPVMLLVLDWFPFNRARQSSLAALVAEKVPLLLLSGGITLITMQATALTRGSFTPLEFSSRVYIAFKALGSYLWLFIWPANISTVYLNPGNIAPDATVIGAMLATVAITGYCLAALRKRPLLLAGWLLFLLPLLPVLSVSGIHGMAPRFTYLPSLSLSLLAAIGLFSLARSSIRRNVTLAGIILLLCILAGITIRDIGHWKDDLSLWTRVIELQPKTFGTAYFQRSLFLHQTGKHEQALADINEALAIAVRKGFYAKLDEIYGQRAAILKSMGNYPGALADLNQIISSTGSMTMGKYHRERSEIHRLLGNMEHAAADLKAAARYPDTD